MKYFFTILLISMLWNKSVAQSKYTLTTTSSQYVELEDPNHFAPVFSGFQNIGRAFTTVYRTCNKLW
ncbi:MAG: hypothetical protein M3Q97_06980 [Bacteroidota bacterium]|nr:hypothetical protein [Bacteroidota bacterium]